MLPVAMFSLFLVSEAQPAREIECGFGFVLFFDRS